MINIGKLLGWVVVWSFFFALSNFLLKYLNKNIISKKFKDKKTFINYYRKLMKFIVTKHKYFGIAAGIIVLVHASIMFTLQGPSITGAFAMILLLSVAGLGIVMLKDKELRKGKILALHRTLSFLLVFAIGAHLILP